MHSALLLLLLVGAGPRAADTLVICPDEYRAALTPWIGLRTGQGHRIEVIGTRPTAAALRQAVREQAARGGLRQVVLVGDVDSPGGWARAVPTHQAPSRVTLHYGSEPTIASDNWYADLDDDDLPDVAIGRLSVDSAAQLATVVEKILTYEADADFGPWRRQINLLAGVGGFGALADAAIEAAARQVITSGVPPEYATRMTYGNWRSPYCPDPRRFQAAVVDSLSEGSWCWVYLGHALPQRLADLSVPDGAYASLNTRALPLVRARHGTPLACLLACYAGAFDGAADCLGEAMLAQPGAPVAVICGSRVTMPYAMSVLGTELLNELFERRPATLGEAFLNAKRHMVEPASRSGIRAGLDGLAALLGPGSLDDELREHLHLFNLLGDPLLRLRLPQPATVDAPVRAQPGSEIEIVVRSPIAGAAMLELVPRRDRLTFRPPARGQFARQDLAQYDAVYARANDDCYARARLAVPAGQTTARLTVPPAAQGACHVRVFVEGREDYAAGAASLEVAAGPAAAVRSAAGTNVRRESSAK